MYQAAENRYEKMEYKRCGRSGVLLPRVSLGLWQNFGLEKPLQEQREILLRAFDMGINHFDLANNYGSPALGKAEENFGEILKSDLGKYRDELLISTKAGFDMWPGPYGNWGSRKYLMASLDQSLKRMGLEYVDIFYHHRPDPETPLEETMRALAEMGVPYLIDQPRYNMFERGAEDGLFSTLLENGVGCICYSPLAQGALTDKYLKGIPQESRAARQGTTVGGRYLSEEKLGQIRLLNELALERGQTLARMALSWVLREEAVTSVLIGASSVRQLEDSTACLDNLKFTQEELEKIDSILK